MSDEDLSLNIFEEYDDLACAVLDDRNPNIANDMDITNAEMAEEVCELLGWEDFDLLAPLDFEGIYVRGSMDQLLAYFYMSHLRFELFNSAYMGQIGDPVLNNIAMAHSEYWYLMLRDKYDSMYIGIETKHSWRN